MNIITVTTLTASGGDFVSLNVSSCSDGWFFEIYDSIGLDFVLPEDKLSEMPDEKGLIKFIDAIRLVMEPKFKGLVFGFLQMNYGKKELSEYELEEAGRYIEVESGDFPLIAFHYKKRLKKWIEDRWEVAK